MKVFTKHGFIYPINYGYIPNTISGDVEKIEPIQINGKLSLWDYDYKI